MASAVGSKNTEDAPLVAGDLLGALAHLEGLRQQGGHGLLARIIEAEGWGAARRRDAVTVLDSQGTVLAPLLGGLADHSLQAAADTVHQGGGVPAAVEVAVDNDQAARAGLGCGGRARLVLEDPGRRAAEAAFAEVVAAASARVPVALAVVVDPPGAALARRREGALVGAEGVAPDLAEAVVGDLDRALASGEGGRAVHPVRGQDVEVVVEVVTPPPLLVVIGAAELAGALARQVHLLGWRVRVADLPAQEAAAADLEAVDEVVLGTPEEVVARALQGVGATDSLCVLTHDASLDTPVLVEALGRGAGYVGVLGSARTQAKRRERLLAAGVAEDDLSRLRAPTGLDLGARTPEETAVEIVAEALAVRAGRSGGPRSGARGGPAGS